MKELLQDIGITESGYYTEDDEYVIELDDSNQYSRIFSLLEKSNEVHEVEDDSVFDLEKNTLYFESEDYDIELSADLDDDFYKLTVRSKTGE